MLVQVKIKLTEPFLGDRPSVEGVRRFVRREGELLLDMSQWNRAARQAMADLHMGHADPSTILFPLTMPLGRVDLYNRKWHEKRVRGGEIKTIVREEMCECIRGGAQMSFDVGLSVDSLLEDKKPVTVEELEKIMTYIGKMIGLSPFGSHFKFGRFHVLSITPV